MTSDKDAGPLRGQRVVVIGGTSGMGLGAARAALSAGARVVVASRRPEAARGTFGPNTERLEHAHADITDEASIRRLFDELGTLDHLLVTATPGAPDKPF